MVKNILPLVGTFPLFFISLGLIRTNVSSGKAEKELKFAEKFDVANDPDEVIIDFAESKVADMSAIDALNKLTERYAKLNKTVHLRHLSGDCRQLLADADKLIDVNIIEDPTYKVAVDHF